MINKYVQLQFEESCGIIFFILFYFFIFYFYFLFYKFYGGSCIIGSGCLFSNLLLCSNICIAYLMALMFIFEIIGLIRFLGILYNVFMFVVVCLCIDHLAPVVMTSMGSAFHLLALMLFISASYLLVFSMVFFLEYLLL
jgi:hypothetical protein